MRSAPVQALVSAAIYLDRTDVWHRAAARRRLSDGPAPASPPAPTGPLGDALAAHAAAWDRVVAAEADRTWSELVLPVERTGRANAQAIVRRATAEQRDALCIGKANSVQTAWRRWWRQHGDTQGVGGRSWSGRHTRST